MDKNGEIIEFPILHKKEINKKNIEQVLKDFKENLEKDDYSYIVLSAFNDKGGTEKYLINTSEDIPFSIRCGIIRELQLKITTD